MEERIDTEYQLLRDAFVDKDVAFDSVTRVNHKPHPYMIGPEHVGYASANHNGMLGQETLEKVGCAHPGCNLSYKEHTSDNVMFLKLKKNVSQDYLKALIVPLKEDMEKMKVDGICFIETEEKFRIV